MEELSVELDEMKLVNYLIKLPPALGLNVLFAVNLMWS